MKRSDLPTPLRVRTVNVPRVGQLSTTKIKRRSIQRVLPQSAVRTMTRPAAPRTSVQKEAPPGLASVSVPLRTTGRSSTPVRPVVAEATRTIRGPASMRSSLVKAPVAPKAVPVDWKKKCADLEAKLAGEVATREGFSIELQSISTLLRDEQLRCSALEQNLQALKSLNDSFLKSINEKKETIEQLKTMASTMEDENRALHNANVDLKGQIRVCVRVRPPLPKEEDFEATHLSFPDMKTIKMDMGGKSMISDFEQAFKPQMDQLYVFNALKDLIMSCLHGYNVSIIAFGQTGSGKTHTMRGGKDHLEGIIPRAVKFIFEQAKSLEQIGWKFEFSIALPEIYNDEAFDLLNKRSKVDLKLTGQELTTVGLTSRSIKAPRELSSILAEADAARKTAATKCNEFSSRSHMVFQLNVKATNEEQASTQKSCLKLVDLAGSERAKESGAEGDRFKEMTFINKSLACLQNCVRMQREKKAHVPYRDSKLTMLLRDCLGGGNSKTMVIVNLNPLDSQSNETKRSIEFATRMRTTKIGVALKDADSLADRASL